MFKNTLTGFAGHTREHLGNDLKLKLFRKYFNGALAVKEKWPTKANSNDNNRNSPKSFQKRKTYEFARKILDSNKNGNSEDKIVTSENILVISGRSLLSLNNVV